MSLVRIGLRMSAVEALRGNTIVGDQVLDSEIGAIGVRSDGSLVSDRESRFVAVYTQSGQATVPDNQPRALYEGGTVELIFEAGITATMLMEREDGAAPEVLEGVPATDADFEFYLDLLGRQIRDCLSDPDNEWAEIWRGFVTSIVKFELLRTDDAQRVRLAGHHLKLTCVVVDDPLPGELADDGGAMSQFLKKLESSGDEKLLARARLMRSTLGTGVHPSWINSQRLMGMSGPELAALGLAPVVLTGTGEAADFAAATVDVDGAELMEVSDD